MEDRKHNIQTPARFCSNVQPPPPTKDTRNNWTLSIILMRYQLIFGKRGSIYARVGKEKREETQPTRGGAHCRVVWCVTFGWTGGSQPRPSPPRRQYRCLSGEIQRSSHPPGGEKIWRAGHFLTTPDGVQPPKKVLTGRKNCWPPFVRSRLAQAKISW